MPKTGDRFLIRAVDLRLTIKACGGGIWVLGVRINGNNEIEMAVNSLELGTLLAGLSPVNVEKEKT